ncbi:NAD-glutamate dehydrogenase [Geoalkalibacter sp.]|uniref:NAD-glutamate dehydrogenase n=1 Tax=Geoalkalibacter sp. TaxID=3041440 RepID=UPI00272EC80C|nr:NAD-glutamate dehydrogenase domain-containing protein [Geoalkalibacter sp.]
MNIFVDTATEDPGRDGLGALTEEILTRLASLAPDGQGEALRQLALELEIHTARSYFQHLPAERLAGWITQIFTFIDARREDVALALVPGVRAGRWYLLTNTPDAPFLVDSLQTLLNRNRLRFQVISHPILTIRRRQGRIVELSAGSGRAPRESLILVELQGLQEKARRRLEDEIREVFAAVLQVERDRRKLSACLRRLEKLAPTEEDREFWSWLQNDNFLPFGYRGWLVAQPGGAGQVTLGEEPLGIFPGLPDMQKGETLPLARFGSEVHRRILRDSLVVVDTTENLSPVHRGEHLYYLGWREPLPDGSCREHAFCGLFSQKFLEEPTFSVPSLRRKIERALQALGIPRGCHDYNKTIDIFNTFPKVELFFMSPEALQAAVRSFTFLYREGAVKVVVAPSLSLRSLTLLLIMPREFYDPAHIDRLEAYIRRFFHAEESSSRPIHLSSDYLSLHVRVTAVAKDAPHDVRRLERGLTEIARPWDMKLRVLLERRFGEELGETLFDRYNLGFSAEYRTLTHPRFALRDIQGMEEVRRGGGEFFSLWGPFHNDEEYFRLQFYSRRETYLNELMPLLENMHLWVIDELDYLVKPQEETYFIKSFAVRCNDERALPLGQLGDKLLAMLIALRRGEIENDNLNRLLVLTGLDWREIDVFRGYRNYYHQLGSTFTKRRVAYALINNPHIALLLFRYFSARFEPREAWSDQSAREEQALSPLRMQLAAALEEVADINEDRILRTFFNLIDSTVRTNFFLRRSASDYFFAFKISAIGIIEMPAPRPLFEIYVHAAAMEGIHLRGGRVARGGIRWSDRPDDFRTEILGLMKTQMTKNALIVPVGSKGGFIVQTPYRTREEGAQLSRAAYVTLMRGLLDLTDNRVGGQVVRPAGLVAYDDEDPYLVVAADKGTAQFSDTANAVSREYRFWLDDAFASGGSQGYDHKALGITARGAWECVKRHFRELGRDIQSEPLSVVGIGDMSGDVFGNGMLLSRQIRLVGAFDHRHIFLDPNPDPAASYRERERLYHLPRSSWEDYDRALISAGGGIYSRQAKDIPLSPQVRDLLGVRHASVDGQDLVRLILQAPADLLWNGGIGTYVKASSEKHEEVGDRNNDAVRIDAAQLRVRVVGEGGNLGFTQRARIEFALNGGRINTDAIDNSAGVDCSDHEVNLKILMQVLAEQQCLADRAERDRLLREVTTDVCAAVLRNNYTQSLALSLDLRRCQDNPAPFVDLTERLANAGLLDRAGECLPTSKELLARPGKSLTRPELAILLAYGKMQLFQALLEKGFSLRDSTREFLAEYFPGTIRERFAAHLDKHPLAQEITATVLTNRVIDLGGSALMIQLSHRSGRNLAECALTFAFFDRILQGDALRQAVFGLDNLMAANDQYEIFRRYADTLRELCLWSLERNLDASLDDDVIRLWRDRMEEFLNMLPGVVPAAEWAGAEGRAADLESQGLSRSLALLVAGLPYLRDVLPLVSLVDETGRDLRTVTCAYRDLAGVFDIGTLSTRAAKVPLRDRWDRLAYETFLADLTTSLFALTRAVLEETDGNVERYLSRRRQKIRDLRTVQQQIQASEPVNFHPFSVWVRTLGSLIPSR